MKAPLLNEKLSKCVHFTSLYEYHLLTESKSYLASVSYLRFYLHLLLHTVYKTFVLKLFSLLRSQSLYLGIGIGIGIIELMGYGAAAEKDDLFL